MITAIICVGLSLLLAVSVSQSAEAGVILLTAFVIGPGTGAVWNSASRLAGDAVGPRMRWQGMRICNAAFPVGMFLAVAALSASPVGGLSVTVAVSVVVSLFWLTRREFVEPPMATVEVRNGEPDMAERVPETAPASDAQDEAAPEEGECCGGAVRAFIPVSFWHGVLIAGVGLLALTLPVSALVFRAMLQHSGTAALALTGGICVGFWLMFSVAPKAGYAVTMLPFLTLSIPLVFVAETASGAGPGFVAACAFSGVALGGVILGSAAVISEQFADARDGSGLTRVLVVASFQTAMVLLGIGLLQQFVTDERVSAALHCFVFVLGILVIRSVPSPVLSSAGIDDDSEDTKNELQDVIAAIRD